MDPCPFYRLRVANLSLNLPATPSPSSCFYCKIKLPSFPLHTTPLPLFTPEAATTTVSASACLTLTKNDLDRLLSHRSKDKKNPAPSPTLTVDVYRASTQLTTCGLFGSRSGKFFGRVRLLLDLTTPRLLHNGWVSLADCNVSGAQLYVTLNLQPDPRFIFEFESESERSPQVFQVKGNIKQPVFSCKFGFSKNSRSESSGKERKGWMVTIHDLSGSPVAAASMVTPFVASPGSNRVSRANPGAWLILRPENGTWNPWGRLEVWCDSSSSIAYRFEILSDAGGITLSTGTLNSRCGGSFSIDISGTVSNSPISTPGSSFDLGSCSGSECGSGSWCWGPQWMYKGFVMSSTVGGERAQVQVGAQHVTCTEDAAVFLALAAAADLSVDACRPFSQKLRKEFRHPGGEVVV